MYLSKLNPKYEALFQLPRRDWTEANGAVQTVWYENRPLGVNTLGTMMKEISEKAVLSTVYTNHCVRATAITLCSEAGLADRHICHISGHRTRTVSNITIPGHHQLSSESEVMFCHLLYNRIHSDNTDEANVFPAIPVRFFSTTKRNVIRSCRITPINILQHRGDSHGMFNSCTINSVQINLNLP